MTDRGPLAGGADRRRLTDEQLEALLAADALTPVERSAIRDRVVRAAWKRERRRRRLFFLSLVPAAAAGLLVGVMLMRALLPGPPVDFGTPATGTPVAGKDRTEPDRVPDESQSPPLPGRGAPREPRLARTEPVISRAPESALTLPTRPALAAVQGTVLDADGRPARDAMVRGVRELDGQLGRVDPTGHFLLQVREGSIRSSFFHVAAPRGRGLRDIVFRHAPGTPVQLRFPRGSTVRGLVLDGETTRPLGDAVISVSAFFDGEPVYREVVANRPSGFTLGPLPVFQDPRQPLSAGRILLQLLVHRRGYVSRMLRFESASELEQALDQPLRLDPAGRLEVRIATPEGQVLPGAVVRLEPTAPLPEPFTYRAPVGPRAGPRGEVGFECVPPGRVRVVVSHPDAQPAPRPEVRIRARETTRCRVTLTLGKRMGGRVLDPSGRPIPGAVLFAIPDDEPSPKPDRPRLAHGPRFTDREGRFRFTGLVPGTYRLHAYFVPIVGREATAAIRPGQRTGHRDVSITLAPSTVDLFLAVRDARTGEAVQACSAILLGPAGRAIRTPEAASGDRRVIHGVDPSRTAVQVHAPGYLPSALHRILLPAGPAEVTVNVALYRPSMLAGVVVDRGGRPVQGALIVAGREEVEPIRPDRRSYHSAGFLRTARTDAEGRFTLTDLRVRNPLGLPFELTVIRPGSEPHTVTGLTLLQGESLEGVRITVP